MGLLQRVQRELVVPRTVTAEQQRLSRPVSFVAGSSGVSVGTPDVRGADALNGSAVVYRCVSAITNPLAALDGGVRGTDGELDVETHPIAQLWNRKPNPMLSSYVVKSVIWQQLELDGEAFVYVDRGDSGTGPATELWPIFDPVSVIVSKTVAGQIDGFVVTTAGGKKVPLLPSEVLWLRYPHPRQPFGALAPWRAASWAAELDAYARSWQHGEYVNGARPEGIFYLGDVDESVHNATVESWRSRHVGARNALKHLFVSGPEAASYVRVGLTPAEMSYIESRRVNAEEIMLAFGVHPDLLRGGATFENQRAAKTNLWSETLLPKLHVVNGEVDRQLLPDLRETFEHDTSGVEALRESQDAVSSRVREQTYADVLTIDEGREQLGLDPLPDGLGAMTLTAYRATVEALALAAFGEPTAGAAVRRSLTGDPLSGGYRPQLPRATVTATRAKRQLHSSPDAIERAYARGEELGRRTIARLAAKQQRVVARKLKDAESRGKLDVLIALNRSHVPEAVARPEHVEQLRQQADDLFDRAYWLDYSREALEPFVAAVYDGGAELAARALGLSFELFDAEVTAQMRARLDTLAGQITDTTHGVIERELLREGVESGESIPKLADRIKSVFDGLATYRAETIARTETVGGHNAASRIAATSSGLVTRREWVATKDTRTRDSHVELDGYTTNGVDDAYPNGCMYPGDPAGPARETVNCRCVELFVVAEPESEGTA